MCKRCLKKASHSVKVGNYTKQKRQEDAMLLEQFKELLPEVNKKTKYYRLEELLDQYKDPVKAIVHQVLERYVQESFEEFMSNRKGLLLPRATDKKEVIDYRNGYRILKQAVIDTLVLENMKIPRNRAGGFHPEILKKAKRRAGKLAELALELFVNGVSTRKVKRSFEKIGMRISGLSKSTVSQISKDLLKEYLVWKNRPITKKYNYLQADGVYVRVRKNSKKRIGTLIIIGIEEDGFKEVLHFTLGTESEFNFDESLQSLIRRGLNIDSVELITLDGSKGPISSARAHFGAKKIQRCVIHKQKNILDKCPKNIKDELKAKLQRLWNMPTRLEAESFLEVLKDEYWDIARNSIECLLADKEDLFRYFSFDEKHRKTIRSTNLIERVIRETRRRTKVMDTLDNEYGVYAILMGVIREQNERWSYKSHWRKS